MKLIKTIHPDEIEAIFYTIKTTLKKIKNCEDTVANLKSDFFKDNFYISSEVKEFDFYKDTKNNNYYVDHSSIDLIIKNLQSYIDEGFTHIDAWDADVVKIVKFTDEELINLDRVLTKIVNKTLEEQEVNASIENRKTITKKIEEKRKELNQLTSELQKLDA